MKLWFSRKLKAIQKPNWKRKEIQEKKNEQVVSGNCLRSEVCGPCEQVSLKASCWAAAWKGLYILSSLHHFASSSHYFISFLGHPPDSSYKVKHEGELHWSVLVSWVASSNFVQALNSLSLSFLNWTIMLMLISALWISLNFLIYYLWNKT